MRIAKRQIVRQGKPTLSRKYYLQIRIRGKPQRFALTEELASSKAMANEIIRNRQRIALALPMAEKKTPAWEHALAFLADLEANGRSFHHLRRHRHILRKIIGEGVMLHEITIASVDAFLHAMAKQGKSPRTRNMYRQAIVGLFNWLVRKQRITTNPLLAVSKAEKRSVRLRRALLPTELSFLLTATEKHNAERALLYRLAIYSGLRKSELQRLKVHSLTLSPSPLLTLPEGATKNRKACVLPLPMHLAEQLAKHCEGKSQSDALIYCSSDIHLRFYEDCQRAGIAKHDAQGRIADFHSLRKCTGTLLALAGVHPRIAQHILRHSTMELTMSVYTDANLLPMSEGINALPLL
ncbi:MAG: hypothetical protein FJ271_03815 [Planctomycetes bacterium]|nr:hypothetical protein [Planctomycetota bacterium]